MNDMTNLKISYPKVLNQYNLLVQNMEESLIEFFKNPENPNYLNISAFDIECVDEEIYNEFKAENVSYSEVDNCIILSSYDNEDYGYLSDQKWNTIQQVYSAVELTIQRAINK